MKKRIEPSEIKPGDVIRWEATDPDECEMYALEYRAGNGNNKGSARAGTHYLLERPEPPFEPKDGMHIQRDKGDSYYSAVRIDGEWLALDPDQRHRHWFGDDWAKEKLAEGWVIIEKPEGVK